MMEKIYLTEDEKDCLQELMNIAYGSATAAISAIIEKFATLSIPKIEIIDSDILKQYLNEKLQTSNKLYVSNQLFNGQISGENIFLIDEDSAIKLSKEFGLEDDEICEDEIKDIVLEITNILSSTVTGKLAELLESSVSYSTPHNTIIASLNELDNRFESEYSHIITISTDLNFKEQMIHGELLVLTKSESSDYLKNALNNFLENY